MTRPPAHRIHGLDTLRALAVTLVVLHHYVLFVSDAPTFGWVGEIGWVGVDLFFALSGYLIGNQIFGGLYGSAGFSPGRFYARRLLRTLPNFWAVLALYVLWPAFRGDAPLLPLWRYLSFTQNIGLEPGTAFSHAWSLCIEEQFYLLLPALVLLAAALRARRRLAWTAIGAAFGLGMAVRWQVWSAMPAGEGALHHYYKFIYYASLCRFDELLAGVALALFKHQQRAAWLVAMRHGNKMLAAGAVVLACVLPLFLADRYGAIATVLGYPLLALGCSLLILAALAPGSLLHRVRVPGAASLALWSYALYLVHKQVCVMVAARLAPAGYGAGDWRTIALSLAASLLAGWLLYRLVETPFMALRTRWVPADAPRAAGA